MKTDNLKTQMIANTVEYWIDFTVRARKKEGLETTDETQVMMPEWPSIGTLKAWVEHLNLVGR